MHVKRISGVNIRRSNRTPISTADRLDQLITWMNTNLIRFNEINTSAGKFEGQIYNQSTRLTNVEMNIDAIQEFMEDILE